MDKRNYTAAKTVFLKACAQYASAAAWLGTGKPLYTYILVFNTYVVGIALYQLGQYHEAEEALAEANIHNNQSPEVSLALRLTGANLFIGLGLPCFIVLKSTPKSRSHTGI